ncbi:MAG TPA: CPBP family intramembrane glutamic endopeptidase [Kofleriaceae bacterium]|nr:CPBP family intramembrane glutamic endopeptidase [Kofleriaceae bacterium]
MYHANRAPLPASTALATWALSAGTFFLIGSVLGASLATNVLAQLLALAALPLAVVRLNSPPPEGVTHLQTDWLNQLAKPIAFLGAAVAGTFCWYLSLRVAWPVVEATGREQEVRDATRAVTGSSASLPWVLVASALVPGTCEEILHRGVLLPSLAARMGRPLALVAVTTLFAVMHIEPARMVSAACVGLVAGLLAIRTGSVWPAVVLHIVNNVWALLLGTSHLQPVARVVAAHPDLALATAAAGTTLGISLAGGWHRRGPPPRSP